MVEVSEEAAAAAVDLVEVSEEAAASAAVDLVEVSEEASSAAVDLVEVPEETAADLVEAEPSPYSVVHERARRSRGLRVGNGVALDLSFFP